MTVEQRERTLRGVRSFSEESLEACLEGHDPDTAGSHALALYRDVVETVPAYRAFLAEQGVEPGAIRSLEDFARLPLLTKANYLQRYPLPELCRGGRLESCDFISVSSGSTGQPTFWPRFVTDELAIARRFEQVFCDSFRVTERRSLAIICFPLGTWVGGMFTTACMRHLSSKGLPVVTVTPGNNKAEIFRVVSELGPLFDQVVLLGYPPFLKDVVDTGLAQGLDWKRLTIRMVMAGEVFSEEWRTLVGQRVGWDDPVFDSASLYGTADAGVLGNETPLSIRIRRFLAEHPDLARQLFGESRLPTLVQYDPHQRYFETVDGTLLFTGDNGVPLVRYHISDTGGVIPYARMREILAGWGFDPVTELSRGDRPATIRELPFVYLFGRSHFTVSYFGANIYPENVTVGLEQPGIQEWVTGKFVLESKEDGDRNRFLSLTVELMPKESATPERAAAIADSVRAQLLRLNSEFAHYVPAGDQLPRVTLLPHGDPDYFPIGVKHRYTRKG